jgi:hypothetical protein
MSSILTEAHEAIAATLFGAEVGVAVPVTYRPRAEGAETPLNAVVQYAGDAVEGGLVAAVQQQAVVHVLVSDVPSPRYQDTIEFDGKTWVVINRERSGPFTWALTVQAPI